MFLITNKNVANEVERWHYGIIKCAVDEFVTKIIMRNENYIRYNCASFFIVFCFFVLL